MRWVLVGVLGLSACGGADARSEEPLQRFTGNREDLHESPLTIQKQAAESCFGGVGNEVPYAVKLTLAKSRIMEAEASPMSDTRGEFPKDCIERVLTSGHFVVTDAGELTVHFGEGNPGGCELPLLSK